MMLGLPIVAFNVAFNRASTHNQALFFREKADLRNIILTKSTQDYYEVGEKLKKVATQEYTWAIITRKYANIIYSFDYNYTKRNVLPKLALMKREFLIENEMAHLEHSLLFYQNGKS